MAEKKATVSINNSDGYKNITINGKVVFDSGDLTVDYLDALRYCTTKKIPFILDNTFNGFYLDFNDYYFLTIKTGFRVLVPNNVKTPDDLRTYYSEKKK